MCVFYTGPISPPEAETYSIAWVSAIRTHRQRRKGALSWEQTKADTVCCRGSCEKEPREQVMCTKIWMQGSYNIQNSFFNTIWSSGDWKKTICKEQRKTKTHPISNNKIRLYLPKFLDSAKWEKMYCSKNVETSSLTEEHCLFFHCLCAFRHTDQLQQGFLCFCCYFLCRNLPLECT